MSKSLIRLQTKNRGEGQAEAPQHRPEGDVEGQIPLGNASVSRRVLKDEGCERWHHTTRSFKPLPLGRGN
ncbi:MAG: hypothetical protein ACUVTD_03105 [Nitrososphaerales archaeon]